MHARCMLHDKELPKMFWAKAANTTIFPQNRFPTNALKDKTSFEAWYGYKPSLGFLSLWLYVFHSCPTGETRDDADF